MTLYPVDAPVRTLITDVPEPNGHPESTDLQVIRTIRDNKRTHENKLQSKQNLSLCLTKKNYHCSSEGEKLQETNVFLNKRLEITRVSMFWTSWSLWRDMRWAENRELQ